MVVVYWLSRFYTWFSIFFYQAETLVVSARTSNFMFHYLSNGSHDRFRQYFYQVWWNMASKMSLNLSNNTWVNICWDRIARSSNFKANLKWLSIVSSTMDRKLDPDGIGSNTITGRPWASENSIFSFLSFVLFRKKNYIPSVKIVVSRKCSKFRGILG